MGLTFLLHGRGRDSVGGSLRCPACDSPRVKFIEKQGMDLHIYRCKNCNTPIRYQTTPLTGEMMHDMMNRRRPQTGNVVNIPGLGRFKIGKKSI